MDLILKYFPELSEEQRSQFQQLQKLYRDWNAKINVISRKDIDELYLKHVLHSLGIAKIISFKTGSRILDVGTGGGFPGVPLAILYPNCEFMLVDSINKKLKVIDAITEALELKNISTKHSRVETINEQFDFIVSRAVTSMPTFVSWVKGKTLKKNNHDLKNGILYLKGGDLTEELKDYQKSQLFDLKYIFEEEFFETKKVVHLPLKYKKN
ncbi:MAG: 16S rRNA (guanine(527)-N(7))-methyltransferase RsmG [Bacteroidia bacterium]|nr:16S rRNA (guanine(527)-N(7))-methyltransferase RsmG [Bacteroidia bacterium]NND26034.1 16S rRNA (guanine(527)-N(7))-methyltransferase RsmG [Flavobacteriaceae bacterium]MBT8279543.1 16S rRNA (guanine(527)-N(7))-methyltransferase RsmG [Bacteroidia bacterium]NNK61034.1 16S rRNA (guanine(527)-N(7))-methyltransferase RsmG [Flavobacteriaceae bacterium]NNL33572.1 16S rRNA (guanine(527)-N(7))-methyltransferase RsmG [Flavobacteriaceae bacterium]